MKISPSQRLIYSLVDPVGAVFLSDEKIFRLINNDFIQKTQLLLKSGLIEELINENYFPKTLTSDITFENHSLVLEHELISVSYPHEWSPSMLKDAALLTIKVNKIAQKYGYYLKDFHPYNILFNGNKPIFIDFGSLTKTDKEAKENIDEFVYSFVAPLILFQEGDYYLAHKLLLDAYNPNSRLLVGSISKYLTSKVNKFFLSQVAFLNLFKIQFSGRLTNRIISKISKKVKFIKAVNSISFLESKIESIVFQKSPNSAWSNYQSQYNFLDMPPRFNKIIQMTKDLSDINTSLDVAGNHAYLSILLSSLSKFKKLTSMDYDIAAIDFAYSSIKGTSTNINLIANNFLELTYDKNLVSRLKSDVVYGLALTHHLVLSQNINICIVFDVFHSLANKYVFIEFMPLGLWAGHDVHTPPIPSWYNVDWFKKNFLHFFDLREEIELEENRVLFFGESKSQVEPIFYCT